MILLILSLNDTVFILGWQHITFRWAETNLYDCKALSPCQELPQFGSEDRDVHGPTYDASRNNSYHSVLNQNEIEQVLRLNYSIVYSEAGYSMTLGQHGIDLSQVDGARMLE